MIRKMLALAPVLFLAVLVLVPAMAGASTPNPSAQAGHNDEGIDPASVTASAKLTVRRVENEPNRLYLFDPETEKTHVVVISDKTKLTARRKKDFEGRRKLDFADLESGQTLKITYRTDDGRITSIQVLEKAS